MKQKIGVFLLSALLVMSLSACGQTGGAVGDNDILGDDYSTTERNYRSSTSPNNGTNGDNYAQNGSNKGTDSRSGVLESNNGKNNSKNSNGNGNGSNGKDSKNNAASRNGKDEGLFNTNGTSYEQMVRNGLVNDSDGDLTDGENPHS